MSVQTETAIPLSAAPASSPRRRSAPEWLDRLVGSDPGLNRLRTALQAVVTIGIAMLAELTFVHFTHALQIDTHGAVLSAAQADLVAAQHHGLLVIAIMLGAIIGMLSAFSGAMFPTTRKLVQGLLALPPIMVAGLALGLTLAPYRLISLAALVVLLAGGAYFRKFGPIGFVGGNVVFMGDFFGFFLHGTVQLSDLGWLTAEICIGAAVAILAQFTIFYPGRRSALRRMRRSYGVRAREVTSAAVDILDGPDNPARAAKRLHRRLARLNETALMIDAQLGNPAAISEPATAARLHQILFDAELALTNMARFAEAAPGLGLPPAITTQLRTALVSVGQLDALRAELSGRELMDLLKAHSDPESEQTLTRPAQVVVHRFAVSVLGFVEAATNWRAVQSGHGGVEVDGGSYQSPILLMGGWLPGSAMVSAAASVETGPGAGGTGWRRLRFWDQVSLAPNVRVAIQMAVAVSGAIILGDVLSGRRFYWAVIAAFVTFMGANNTGEQVRKGLLRVIGTVVGVLVGATLAHLVGQRTHLAIAVILVSLFFGLYLMRISYAFMVVGITIMVSQLYVQLDEFSNSLLVLRLEETALGAGIAALTVICVLPLRTGRVARVAAREYLTALARAIDESVHQLLSPDRRGDLRAAFRSLDSAYHSLITTMAPLRNPWPNRQDTTRERFLTAAAASRHYAQNLLVDLARDDPAGNDLADNDRRYSELARTDLTRANARLAESLAELITGLRGVADAGSRGTYVRAASLFGLVATDLAAVGAAPSVALRDLELLDGALATMADISGLIVRALDTRTGPDARSTP